MRSVVDGGVYLTRLVAGGLKRNCYSQLESDGNVLLGECSLPWQQERKCHLDGGAAVKRWLTIPIKRAGMSESL